MLNKWERTAGDPVEIFNDVSLMALDSILKCAMSTETNCQRTRQDFKPTFHSLSLKRLLFLSKEKRGFLMFNRVLF